MSSFAPEPAKLDWLTPTRAALTIWLLLSAAMLFAYAPAIATLTTGDPDDALRLVQVRDLIGGQAWWDVSQHRINPAGGGGLMHWSRIVDAPLALGVSGLTPIVGSAMAEQVVMALWPLLLLGVAFVVMARMASDLGDRRVAFVAPLLLATDFMILYQFAPLRIDHHGWQILLTLAALATLLREADGRSGIFAGLLSATLLAISLEGLPAVALLAAMVGLEWVWSGSAATRKRLTAYLVALASAAAILQFVTRGPDALAQRWCDALSLPYLGALMAAAILVAAGALVVARLGSGRVVRLAILGFAGVASGATLLAIEPLCIKGPFAALDPLVVHYWYANVREGLPLWQPLDGLAGYSLAPTLVGLAGCWLGWCSTSDAAVARRWLMIGGALAGLALLSLLVLRTGATAHVVALPGCALVAVQVWTWARGIAASLPRILASLLTLIALPPVAGALAAVAIAAIAGGKPSPDIGAPCIEAGKLGALTTMPPSVLLAPLDIGPGLLQHTRHSVVATGHHRNNVVMAETIRVFVGDPARAERRARALGAEMILVCPSAPEWRNFRAAPGDGLAADLSTGRVPAWLEPVPLGDDVPLRAWQVVPSFPGQEGGSP